MKIVKVGLINGLGKTKGCEKAPDLIFEELGKVYSSETGKEINQNFLDVSQVEVDNGNVLESFKKIYEKSLLLLKSSLVNKFIFLGGDHSLSFCTVKAFLNNCKLKEKEPCLIVFDAHPDCMRPVDKDFPTHEEWIRGLVEEGFPGENILLVGIRNSWKDENSLIKEKGIRVMSTNKLLLDLEDACDTIMEFSNGKELYVSIDIDVCDPAFAPGTGYCEVGGISSRALIYLVGRISKIKSLRVLDIVEINPDKDKNNLTTKLGAKILGKLI